MGNRLAPPFATLFMHSLETKFLITVDKTPAIWLRYIHDVFGIWLYGVESLEQFHHTFNRFHPPIKFSLEHIGNMQSISFLDADVSLTKEGIVRTKLYAKPTHSRVLLHYSSAHPSSTKEVLLPWFS